MSVFIHAETKTFHLQNSHISYVMSVLPGGQLTQLYFGKRIADREDFGYLLEGCIRSHSAYPDDDGRGISLEHVRLEYPAYGNSDFREGAIEILQNNGSRLTEFRVSGWEVLPGKPVLEGLPATYTESDGEAETLVLKLTDDVTGLELSLLYTIFAEEAAIARSAKVTNRGSETVHIEKIMSLSLDLPDADYDMIQLTGSWARERRPETSRLIHGIQGVESLRGHSSHQHNPFIALKRPETGEKSGEAMGFSLVYSGNFLAHVQVDSYDVSRVLLGINPTWFSWKLEPGASFQAPEAVVVYSDSGLNGMSQTYHRLYGRRLARGIWRDRPRPILLNNWEATYFDFNEEKLLGIAKKAKECGVELFVLDDGWFGGRRDDTAGLGDWYPAKELLPNGIAGLSRKVEELGLKFGLWIEPEMVNPDSDLFREHPDYILAVPERRSSLSRHQLVLDFSRKEVVDCIYGMISKLLRESKISYIKWDMNRSVTECGSAGLPADQQGEVFHRHILGIYSLYERLTSEFPDILFESCAGGGARFDPGLLYYAPQAWTSDDTDAVERLTIQYGTSFVYPVSSMGSHVSAVPNHQVNRITPLETRANVAFFGTYGYELDLGKLTEEEQEQVKTYTAFMKENRKLLQFGTFYRLRSPLKQDSAAWMTVSEDGGEAIVGYYKVLNHPNTSFRRLRLDGLCGDAVYEVTVCGADGEKPFGTFSGSELMNAGLVVSDFSSCKVGAPPEEAKDFRSVVFHLRMGGSL